MSKTENTTPAIVIEDFTPEPSKSIYDDTIVALIEAGEGKAGTITVDAENEATHKRFFQKSARNAGKTAVQKRRVVDGDTVLLTFVLTDIRTVTRKYSDADQAEDASESTEDAATEL